MNISKNYRGLVIATFAVIALILAFVPASSAVASPARQTEPMVSQVEVVEQGSTLTLKFDSPIPADDASRAASDALAGDLRNSSLAAASARPLSCNNGLVEIDSNGRFTLDHVCGDSSGKRMLWSYRMSAGVEAIVVGSVAERGLDWAVDGSGKPRNAPHPAEGAGYVYHGTLRPFVNGNVISYSDYLTFRHNVGPGGSGRIDFAGSVRATKVEG